MMNSTAVCGTEAQLLAECEERGEMKFLTIDGAYKPCMPLLGQAPHGAPAAQRANQALPNEDAVHAVVTVRGLWRRQTRTPACLRHAVKLSFFPCPGPPSVSPLSFPLSSHQLRAGFSSPLLALQSPKPVVAS